MSFAIKLKISESKILGWNKHWPFFIWYLVPLFPFLCLAKPCPNQHLVQTSAALAPLLCRESFNHHVRWLSSPHPPIHQCPSCKVGHADLNSALCVCVWSGYSAPRTTTSFALVKSSWGWRDRRAWTPEAAKCGRGGPRDPWRTELFLPFSGQPLTQFLPPLCQSWFLGCTWWASSHPHYHSGSLKSALVGVLTPDHGFSVFAPYRASPYHWLQLTTFTCECGALIVLDKWSLDFMWNL